MSGSQAVKQGEEFYRLLAEAVSSGDIYTVDVAATAIAVGPESDFSSYDVYYYDSVNQVPQKISISVDQPFTGDLFVDTSQQYAGSSQGGNPPQTAKLIVVPTELYLPGAISTSADAVIFPPMIDLMFFLKEDPIIPNRRPPKRIRTPIPLGSSQNAFAIPLYGRKSFAFRVIEAGSGETLTVNFVAALKFMFPIADTTGTTLIAADAFTICGGITLGSLYESWIGGMSVAKDQQSADYLQNKDFLGVDGNALQGVNALGRGGYDYLFINVSTIGAVNPGDVSMGGCQLFFESYDE